MSRDWCSTIPTGIRLAVQLAPNAKKNEVIGAIEGALKLKLHAPPIDGKANEALIRFIAESLDVPKSAVSITHGFTSKRKLLEVRTAHLTVDAVKVAFGQT